VTEPKRCESCGAVSLCDCLRCPACGRQALRALTETERKVWDGLARDHDSELCARAVQVRCGLA